MTRAIFLLGLDTHCVNVCVQYLYQCHLFLSTDVCLTPQSLTSSFVGEEVTLCLGCASLATEICVIIKQRYRLFSFNFGWERLGRKQQRPLQTKRSFNSMQLETFDKQPVCKWWVGWKCNKCFCCQYCILFLQRACNKTDLSPLWGSSWWYNSGNDYFSIFFNVPLNRWSLKTCVFQNLFLKIILCF